MILSIAVLNSAQGIFLNRRVGNGQWVTFQLVSKNEMKWEMLHPHSPLATRQLYRTRKLLQKPHIILTEQPDIIDAVFHHGGSFNAHAKGKTAVFIGIDIAVG